MKELMKARTNRSAWDVGVCLKASCCPDKICLFFLNSLRIQSGTKSIGAKNESRLTCYASVHRFTDEEQTEVADEVLWKVQLGCNSLQKKPPHNI